jgi:hypothetical protein
MWNFYWIYDLPNWVLCLLIIGVFGVFSMIGIKSTRKLARRLMVRLHGQNEAVGIYVSAIGVFYGITLGLITVGASTTFNDISSQVDQEATSIASFYRKISNYPEPTRSILQNQTKEYTTFIIDQAWPLQRQGIIPKDIIKQVVVIEKSLKDMQALEAGAIANPDENRMVCQPISGVWCWKAIALNPPVYSFRCRNQQMTYESCFFQFQIL